MSEFVATGQLSRADLAIFLRFTKARTFNGGSELCRTRSPCFRLALTETTSSLGKPRLPSLFRAHNSESTVKTSRCNIPLTAPLKSRSRFLKSVIAGRVTVNCNGGEAHCIRRLYGSFGTTSRTVLAFNPVRQIVIDVHHRF